MKKRLFALMMALMTIASSVPASATETTEAPAVEAEESGNSFIDELESRYVDPDRVYSTDVRWWLGSASATDETLLEEIQALYNSGFRGVELCMQADGVAADEDYSYGSEMWAHKWKLMMNKLLDLGMGVYLTSGTNWASANVPESYLDPTSEAAMQIVAIPDYRRDTENPQSPVTLASGESVEDTLQTPMVIRDNTSLMQVYAYEIDANGDIIYDSYIDLLAEEGAITGSGTEYTLSWTAPGEGQTYMVIPFWTQGSYELSTPATENCYTINYFNEAGVEMLKSFWTDHYLNDEELNAKILEGDVELFMDSLEIKYGGSSEGMTWYNADVYDEFLARKGYDIRPYLILIDGVGDGSNLNTNLMSQAKGTYDLAGNAELRKQIINDYQDVMTQLYEERMLIPIKEWLNSIGITTRAQISYGKALEITEPAQYVDYPEAENLNQYNQPDMLRLHTAGAKLLDKTLSTETGGKSIIYAASWQELLNDAYSQFAVGFQRIIWHVWSSEYGYGNYNWPGYNSGFNGENIFYRWSTREPASDDYAELNAHLGRVQEFVQEGVSRTDIGMVYQNWTQGMIAHGEDGSFDLSSMNWRDAHQGIWYRSTELQDNGYTYDYFSPEYLYNDEVTYNAETNTIEWAGYRALVIFQDWLSVRAAEKIYEIASQGLPVVILEGAASYSPFVSDDAAELEKIMTSLKELDNVAVASANGWDVSEYNQNVADGYDNEVYEKLQELGVRPYAEFDGANHQLLTQTREDEDGNRYLYVYNYCSNTYHEHSYIESVREEDHGTNIQTSIKMDGIYVPYVLDAWSGQVTELAEYTYENGQTVIPVDLDYADIALYVFEKVDEEADSITSTDAYTAYANDGALVIRATESGEYNTVLSSGETVTSTIEVPASYDITGWDVTVSSYNGNEEAGDLVRTETIGDLTTENRKTSTVITDINVQLDTLTTWDNIEGVGKEVSGTGHYEATFNWDSSAASGAYLDFGTDVEYTLMNPKLQQSMTVWINGVKVGGEISTNETKANKSVGASVDDGTGNMVELEGVDQYTGGISLVNPIVDVSDYLVDGENTIVLEYSSDLCNVMITRGTLVETEFNGTKLYIGPFMTGVCWWDKNVAYRSYGPKQAVIIPFVDEVVNQ